VHWLNNKVLDINVVRSNHEDGGTYSNYYALEVTVKTILILT